MNLDNNKRLFAGFKFVGFCGFCAFVVYTFFEVSQILGLLLLPLAAGLGARYIVHGAFDDAPYWIRKWMYRGWHGEYYEFDGHQLRIDNFGGDMRAMPLVAVQDLENLFQDKARFRISQPVTPSSGLLSGIPSIPADRAVTWAKSISRTTNSQADGALKLALFIERTFIEPRERELRLDKVKAFESDRER